MCSTEISQQQDMHDDSGEHQPLLVKPSLAPVDTGKEAWLFLAACWAVEALTFGAYLPARSLY
jgi:hypothetical protein